MALVLRVPGPKRRDGSSVLSDGAVIARRLEQRRGPVAAEPASRAQSSSQASTRTVTRGSRTRSRTRASSRDVGDALRLLVERRVEDRSAGSSDEADRDEPRPAVRADRGQDGPPRPRQEVALAGRQDRVALHLAPIMQPCATSASRRSGTSPADGSWPSAASSLEVRDDRVVGEAPLEIRAAGPHQDPVAVAVTMRTPGHEAELAVGLPSIGGPDPRATRRSPTSGGDPATLSQPDDTIVVRLSKPFDDPASPQRHFIATASCGICGKASIDEVAVRCDPLAGRAGRLPGRHPRAARPAARRPARVRRDRRPARGRPVHARAAS